MFANERRDKICKMLKTDGAVTTARLVKHFNVSLETVRRDLLQMEQENLLKRVHGGAVSIGEMKFFSELSHRNEENGELKKELAFAATDFVNEKDIIGIDAGSTAIFFAEALKERFSELIVVTYSKDVFDILCKHENFNVILCGGNFIKSENAFWGPFVIDMLSKLHMQKVFIFPTAVSLENGICDYQCDIYSSQQQMIKSSDEIYILADSTKYEKKALLKLSDMKRDYCYVTDSQLPDELKKLYEENDIQIYVGGNLK